MRQRSTTRKLAYSTHAVHAVRLDHTNLPALGALQLHEFSVARLDALLEALEPSADAPDGATPGTRAAFNFVSADRSEP
jgi:hypothetical protein